MKNLIELIAKLRDPIKGCEWDLAQTTETLPSQTIEEMYELFDALTRDKNSQKDYSPEVCEEI